MHALHQFRIVYLANHHSAGIQKNPTLTWGGQYKNITDIRMPLHNANGTLITDGVYELPLIDPIVENSQYVVRAHVVDNYGCHGVDGNSAYLVGKLCRNLSYIKYSVLYAIRMSE